MSCARMVECQESGWWKATRLGITNQSPGEFNRGGAGLQACRLAGMEDKVTSMPGSLRYSPSLLLKAGR